MTLFDSPDDDDYDGDLDQNDEECPKALINFNVDPANNLISNKIFNETVECARSKWPTPEKNIKSGDEDFMNDFSNKNLNSETLSSEFYI